MDYEYESTINSFINESLDDSDIKTEIEQENKEVYRKAKAWDKYILSVEEDVKNEFGDNEDLVKHAVELNEKIFMEDE